MNLVLVLASALVVATSIEPTDHWDGIIADESLQKLVPVKKGFIADAKSLTRVWKAWRPDEKVPKIDFTKDLIVVGVVTGPNRVMIQPSLDEKGDLRLIIESTEVEGPGFGYRLLKVSREGVKSVNGKPVEKGR